MGAFVKTAGPAFRPRPFWACFTGFLLLACGCVPESAKRDDAAAAPLSAPKADDLLIVDCLLPGRIQRLGSKATYVTARRAIRTTAQDCEIRGGEYTAYDRATYATALQVWLPQAREGDADAQNKVGEIYEKGLGGTPDYGLAAQWYRRAAVQGFSPAQINLGFLYEKGLGVSKDPRAALSWYRKASDLPEAVVIDRSGSDQVRQQLASANMQIGRIRDDLKHYNRLAAKSAGELDRVRGDLARTRGRLEAPSAEKGADDKRVLELEMALRDREQELDQQKEMVAQLNTALEQWRRKVEELEQKVRSAGLRTASDTLPADLPQAPPSIQLIEPPLVGVRGSVRIPVQQGLERRVIVGRVVAPAGLLAVTLNGAGLPVDAKGLFRTEVVVRGAVTRIDVAAVDSAGKRSSLEFELVTEGSGESPETTGASPLQGVDFGHYHALVIGNRDYQSLPDLKTSRRDAEAMAALLRERFGFETTLLIDATRYQILSELNRLRKELTSEDNLLIYYAGHGELDEVNLRGHWLPVDAEADNTANWISNVAITDILNVMQVLHVLVIADSCYSGALTRSALANIEAGSSAETRGHWVSALAEMQSRTALSSGGLEPVLDSGGGDHSVFAKALIDVLGELDDVAEGQRIYQEVAARVAYESGDYQVPQYAPIKFSGHQSGDFLFVPRTLL